jgi:CHAT domain-containing protein
MNVLDGDTIVVINATSCRCDGFVINKQQGVSLVELKRLKLEDVNTRVERLRSSRPYIDPTMLEWLWDDIASPILEKLGFDKPSPAGGSQTRIFWILTGPLSRLPIHAAETVMDGVMSSYSSSLRSFVHGKKAKPRVMRIPEKDSTNKALLVGMDKTPGDPGLSDLPFAAKEIESLEKLCPVLNLEPVRLSSQSREAVLAELGALLFHFAGHGQLDPLDPSQSGLHLEDGLLTVADIQVHKLGEQVPFLGYLSACLTGANDADALVDEGIHLISACQLASFHHVIGSLWQVYDDSCVEVSESVYKGIAEGGMTDRSVCAALHNALMNLRYACCRAVFGDA